MVEGAWAPDRGDIIWLDFDPQSGHEQRGRRPALILSPQAYNERAGLALACPISTQIKGYPFEVQLPRGLDTSGVVLADQVRSIDWRARRAHAKGRASDDVVGRVVALVE